MSTQTRPPALDSNTCINCWWRPSAPNQLTCTPCFFRPERWRVPCTCTDIPEGLLMPTCPHGKTGHCNQCPRAEAA